MQPKFSYIPKVAGKAGFGATAGAIFGGLAQTHRALVGHALQSNLIWQNTLAGIAANRIKQQDITTELGKRESALTGEQKTRAEDKATANVREHNEKQSALTEELNKRGVDATREINARGAAATAEINARTSHSTNEKIRQRESDADTAVLENLSKLQNETAELKTRGENQNEADRTSMSDELQHGINITSAAKEGTLDPNIVYRLRNTSLQARGGWQYSPEEPESTETPPKPDVNAGGTI